MSRVSGTWVDEQFRDAAAVRGRVDVQHAGALERRRELPQAFDRPGLDDPVVVVEVLVEQRNTFEHGRVGPLDGQTGGPSGQSIARAPRSRVSDKFRGTLSATEASAAIAAGLERSGFDDVVRLPLADGGEGTIDALLAAAAVPCAPRASRLRSATRSTHSGRYSPTRPR